MEELNCMAGHSKWKNIQHRKGRQDAIRAKAFTKVSKEIYMAARNGGGDPNTNLSLRAAIAKAKSINMPNENIERTIKKAIGDIDGITYEEITYEGYGPGGVAVLIEVLTDNRNRSAAEVRHIFSKNGGNLGESGCVSFLFTRKGEITINREVYEGSEDDLMLVALEAGAEDIQTEDDQFTVYTNPDELEQVKEELIQNGIPIASAEVTMVPATTVKLTGEDAAKMIKLMEMAEDSDDIQNIYANFEIDESEIEKLG